MNISRLTITRNATIPLMAAFPYRIEVEERSAESCFYDAATQLTRFARRDFSTCREDESVGVFYSKADTKKDD